MTAAPMPIKRRFWKLAPCPILTQQGVGPLVRVTDCPAQDPDPNRIDEHSRRGALRTNHLDLDITAVLLNMFP